MCIINIINYDLNQLKSDQIRLIRRFVKVELSVNIFSFN